MQFTTSDIQLAETFAKNLSEACREMLDAVPVSQALARNSVSQSTFSTLVRGLRKSEGESVPDDKDIEKFRHPAWQDDLVYDLCGEKYVYIPSDFDEILAGIEDEYLEDAEKNIIDSFYNGRKSVKVIAQEIGINESNVRVKKNQALMKLREHVSDLVAGKKYLSNLGQMKEQYRRHQDELSWMKSAIAFMERIAPAFDNDISSDDSLTDEEKNFYTDHGVRRLRDLMNVNPEKLLFEFTESAAGYAAALSDGVHGGEEDSEKKFRSSDGSETVDFERVYPDTDLGELGLRKKTLDAFHSQGLDTVGDVLSLDEEEVRSIPDVGDRQIIHLCWQALHGIEKKGNTDGEDY